MMSRTDKKSTHKKTLSNQKLYSSINKVYQINRQHDHELDVELEDIRRKEHMENVRRYSDVRQLQRMLSDMRLEKNQLTQTFTPEEINNESMAPVISWRKIQTHRLHNRPRLQRRRKSEGTKALLSVAENAEFTAKNKFRSAIMAVCLSKTMTRIIEGDETKDEIEKTTPIDQEITPSEHNSEGGDEVKTDRMYDSRRSARIKQHDVVQVEKVENDNVVLSAKTAADDRSKRQHGRLSLLDLIRSNITNNANHDADHDYNGRGFPTFGQLHPRRRSSSLSQPRRPSTSVAAVDYTRSSSSSSAAGLEMNTDKNAKRLSLTSAPAEENYGESASSRMTTPANLNRCVASKSKRMMPVQHDAYGRGVCQGRPLSDSSTVSSFHRKRKSELAQRDREMMTRVRQFLESSMPR